MIFAPVLKYIAGGLGVIALMLALALHFERKSHEKSRARIVALNEELQRITTAKDEQRKTTESNVGKVEKAKERADRIVERIVKVPNPLNCETPKVETEGLL